MSKERLESLKRNKEWTEATGGKFYTVDSDDYKWLIKQAERVHELESNSYNAHLERLLDRREQQIKRYREALEAIAYFDDKEEGEVATRIDVKYIARKALGRGDYNE